jgi:hypothetical protein
MRSGARWRFRGLLPGARILGTRLVVSRQLFDAWCHAPGRRVALILMPSCALCALVRHFDYDRVDLAAIDAVLQHEIKGTAGELLASTTGAAYVGPPLAPDPCFFQFAL